MPPGPFTTSSSGFVVRGSSSAGSSPGKSRTDAPPSRCASSWVSASTSWRRAASPDFACFCTRSSRRSTWSRSATSSSSSSVSRSAAGSEPAEKPSATASTASTCRSPPRRAGPVPGTSTTRSVAGVTLRAPTSSASCGSRGSGIDAIPTFSLPNPPPPVRVRAVKSVVFPEPGSPTMPTSSAITRRRRRRRRPSPPPASAARPARGAAGSSRRLRSCPGWWRPRRSRS